MGEQTRKEQTDRNATAGNGGSLLPADQNERFTSRWEEIQASFVDRPQDAVEEADSLVSDLMQRVTSGLSSERQRLEKQWAAGDDVSTEDLRVALTRYRAFFDRLLKT
jgi:glutathione S-transferase